LILVLIVTLDDNSPVLLFRESISKTFNIPQPHAAEIAGLRKPRLFTKDAKLGHPSSEKMHADSALPACATGGSVSANDENLADWLVVLAVAILAGVRLLRGRLPEAGTTSGNAAAASSPFGTTTEVVGISITLEIADTTALFVLLDADGSINRKEGRLENTEQELFVGKRDPAVFEVVRLEITRSLTQRWGNIPMNWPIRAALPACRPWHSISETKIRAASASSTARSLNACRKTLRSSRSPP
jgi:hypothetical protein